MFPLYFASCDSLVNSKLNMINTLASLKNKTVNLDFLI